jgi:hypothetical protein
LSGFDLPRQAKYANPITEVFASDRLNFLNQTAAFRRIDLHCRFEREHLDMAFTDGNVVAVPCDRTLHDLPVYSSVAAELVARSPLFKVEEVAEKLKGLGLIKQTQSQRAAEVGLKDRRSLFKVGQHS